MEEEIAYEEARQSLIDGHIEEERAYLQTRESNMQRRIQENQLHQEFVQENRNRIRVQEEELHTLHIQTLHTVNLQRPQLELRADQYAVTHQISLVPPGARVYSEPIDSHSLGSMNVECPNCHALHFLAEKLTHSHHTNLSLVFVVCRERFICLLFLHFLKSCEIFTLILLISCHSALISVNTIVPLL